MIRLLRWRPVSTVRSEPAGGLRVIPCANGLAITHWLRVPMGACPVSGNPIGGMVRIAYFTGSVSVEVVALREMMQWAVAGGQGAPASVEGLARWVQSELARAGIRAQVTLWVLVRPGPQILRVGA